MPLALAASAQSCRVPKNSSSTRMLLVESCLAIHEKFSIPDYDQTLIRAPITRRGSETMNTGNASHVRNEKLKRRAKPPVSSENLRTLRKIPKYSVIKQICIGARSERTPRSMPSSISKRMLLLGTTARSAHSYSSQQE